MAWVTSRPLIVGAPDDTGPDGPVTTTCAPMVRGASEKVSTTELGRCVTVVPSAGLVRSSTSWAKAAEGTMTSSPRASSAEARRRMLFRLRRARNALDGPPEAAEAVPVEQPGLGAGPLERREVGERVGARERVRRGGARQPQGLQRLSLGAHDVRVERVHRDVGREVARPVGHRGGQLTAGVCRERPTGGTRPRRVAVVHGDERARGDARDEVGPRLVTGATDLDAVARPGGGPVGVGPETVRSGEPGPEGLLAGRGVDEDLAGGAVGVDLGHGARDDVEPLVRDDEGVAQVGELGREARAAGGAEPLDLLVETLWTVDDINGKDTDPGARQRGEGLDEM